MLNRVRGWLSGPKTVLEYDWDTLVILDACRADYFAWPGGGATTRRSVASSTPEFLEHTFDGRRCWDTVYVTANPQPLRYVAERSGTPFHATVSVLGDWDDSLMTVPPSAVTDAAIDAADSYPNKRCIVHYLQPHAPFIGPSRDRLRAEAGGTIGAVDPSREYTDVHAETIEPLTYRQGYATGASVELIRQAYRENAMIVTNEAKRLTDALDGKTAITADHGELLGERGLVRRQWEHPRGSGRDELRNVPWVVVDGDRRETFPEPPTDTARPDGRIGQRLRELGYV